MDEDKNKLNNSLINKVYRENLINSIKKQCVI